MLKRAGDRYLWSACYAVWVNRKWSNSAEPAAVFAESLPKTVKPMLLISMILSYGAEAICLLLTEMAQEGMAQLTAMV